jgi:hypothetical protein
VSMGAGVVSAPFGSMSLTELRNRAMKERGVKVPTLVLGPEFDEPRQAAVPTFDEVLAGNAVWDESVAWPIVGVDGSFESDPPRRVALVLLVGALGPAGLGAIIFFGLLWSAPVDLTPPPWFPEAFWYGPWSKHGPS